MSPSSPRLLRFALFAGVLLLGIFASMVLHYHTTLRTEIRRTIINRDAAVLHPVALRQLAQEENSAEQSATTDSASAPLDILLENAQQKNILALAIFDAQGRTHRYAPDSLLFAELPVQDFAQLLKAEPISRYHTAFPLEKYFTGISADPKRAAAPVLEVLLPLHGRDPAKIIGFAQYFIDARPLTDELASIDERMRRQTTATLGIGALLIAAVVTAAYFSLRRAHRQIAERNDRLVRANLELTLTAKTSALGQITSHLMHSLQGSVSGLRTLVQARDAGLASATDWTAAAGYTEHIQAMIQETIALLSDSSAQTSYELTGHELAALIQQRNVKIAVQKGVNFKVHGGFDHCLDSHRGGLLCLIANNLVQNAIEATSAQHRVSVDFRNGGTVATLKVIDEGHGIPREVHDHLFEPGRSGRSDGNGIGLAISHLLARQMGATLLLDSTGPTGSTFSLTVPLIAISPT